MSIRLVESSENQRSHYRKCSKLKLHIRHLHPSNTMVIQSLGVNFANVLHLLVLAPFHVTHLSLSYLQLPYTHTHTHTQTHTHTHSSSELFHSSSKCQFLMKANSFVSHLSFSQWSQDLIFHLHVSYQHIVLNNGNDSPKVELYFSSVKIIHFQPPVSLTMSQLSLFSILWLSVHMKVYKCK